MGGFRKYLLTILTILLLFPVLAAGKEKRDSVIVSLVTCSPGSEIYELCGHEAIRTRRVGVAASDTIWNYGVFDFNEPNFVYRFVKGETDYMLAGYPFAWFVPEYQATGREIVEQELNLSQDEAYSLMAMLREESKPENCRYRYNYVRDNCATRIIDRLDSVTSERIIYPDNVKYGSFRNEMRAYHKNYPWYQFGIDLALGAGLDIPSTGRMEMFVPMEMMEKAETAHFADGRPLVRNTRVYLPGTVESILPATPWYLAPLFVSFLLLAIVAVIAFVMIRKKIIARWLYSLWFGVTGLAGCLVSFLVFVSEHEATSPNMLIFWLNPLQLFFAISIWSRKLRYVSLAMAYWNIFAVGTLMIVWPFQAQSANPAFFPLMAVSVILGAVFAIIYPQKLKAPREKGHLKNKAQKKTFKIKSSTIRKRK